MGIAASEISRNKSESNSGLNSQDQNKARTDIKDKEFSGSENGDKEASFHTQQQQSHVLLVGRNEEQIRVAEAHVLRVLYGSD